MSTAKQTGPATGPETEPNSAGGGEAAPSPAVAVAPTPVTEPDAGGRPGAAPSGPRRRRGRRRRGRALARAHRRSWPYPETFAPGNDVDVFHEGGACFDAMLEAIGAARSTVHLETYLLRSDRTGWRFARALAERARAGLEVALMYDSVGGLVVSRAYLAFLHEAGVRVIAYHPLLPWRRRWGLTRRDHRKILVVDGAVAFVGGMNVSDHPLPVADGGEGWRDTHLRILGPAAAGLDRLFLEEWVRQGGRPLTEHPVPGPRPGGVPVRIAENRRLLGRVLIRAAYLDALRSARRRIWIVNSYFVPDRRFVRALIRAARRGVDVRIVLAGRSDVPIVQWAGEHLYARLLRAGVRLYAWDESVLHAKTAVVDGRWATVGTYNLDHRSLQYNLEVNAMILNEAVAARMETFFLRDVSRSRQLVPEAWRRRPWWARLRSWLCFRLRLWL